MLAYIPGTPSNLNYVTCVCIANIHPILAFKLSMSSNSKLSDSVANNSPCLSGYNTSRTFLTLAILLQSIEPYPYSRASFFSFHVGKKTVAVTPLDRYV